MAAGSSTGKKRAWAMPSGFARVVSARGTDGFRRRSFCVASRQAFEADPKSFPMAIPQSSLRSS
jgi:hypothetical protein